MNIRLVSRAAGRVVPLVVLLAGVALLGSCDAGGTEPGDDVTAVNVTVRADGAARSGVTVRLFAASSQTALSTKQTGSTGIAAFTGLEAGSYEAEVVVPDGLVLADGEVDRKSVTAAAGSTASVAFDLVAEPVTGEVVEIHLTSGNQFDPSSVTISVGTTVRWVNDINRFHTITPDDHSEWQRQEMSTAGQTFTHTFNVAGSFPYFCEPHQSEAMTGTVTVQ